MSNPPTTQTEVIAATRNMLSVPKVPIDLNHPLGRFKFFMLERFDYRNPTDEFKYQEFLSNRFTGRASTEFNRITNIIQHTRRSV